MKGPTTILNDPSGENEPKRFTFDYSYWSHDSFKAEASGYLAAAKPHYADQNMVFKDVGMGVLANAWEGYNCSLFAYGQTGSGKSWSIVGYGPNKGIVPLFCDKLFVQIDEKKSGGEAAAFEVEFSMLEIYNEQVRDLLNPASKRKGGLKVRQHPKLGFYADGLKTVAVNSYQDIENRMEEGTKNRTVAATQMNATSSRAHTIVGIKFTQKYQNAAGQETAKSSVINLVDLAGSERAESTGATGDRLKEGAAINQSLSSLGNVIAALVDKANGKKVRIPYRDSTLTKLLKNALGGNSKTIMIAAISPADINYDETLSTLRYADRAKQIKTKVAVNEDPTEKLIRELQEENEKLKKLLESGGIPEKLDDDDDDDDEEDAKPVSKEERERIRKELEEEMQARILASEQEMEEMKKTWEEKMQQSQSGPAVPDASAAKKEKESTPHLYNLNVDPQLTGMIVHLLKPGEHLVGSSNEESGETPSILLKGLNIHHHHAALLVEGDKVFLDRCEASPDAKIIVNGEPLTEKEELEHNDRIMFGANHLYIFAHPKQAGGQKKPAMTYEEAQAEMNQNSGFVVGKGSLDDLILNDDLIEVRPAIEQANTMSEEMDKKVKFELVIIPAKILGMVGSKKEVMVKMRNVELGLEYLWTKAKFMNRKYLMDEMYESFSDGEDINWPDERDPFTEPPDHEEMIGGLHVYLESIAYKIEAKEQLDLTNIKGIEVGKLNVELWPCTQTGKVLRDEDAFVDDPETDLKGQPLAFKVKILNARGLPDRFTDIYCKFRVYTMEPFQTQAIKKAINPDFKFEQLVTFNAIDKLELDYLLNGSIFVQLYGKQVPKKREGKKLNTKQIMKKEGIQKGKDIGAENVPQHTVDEGKVGYQFQVLTLKKRLERLEKKMAQMNKVVDVAEKSSKMRVKTETIKTVLRAKNPDAVEKAIKTIPKDKGAGDNEGVNGQPQSQESSACTLL
ncbi:kinesin-like protein KIF28 [Branchiostoma lanceolatum]|uniref:kinesin-like protein KIF28 n=1 Tax=Branchiostoma lanceolatum TaxID=7740 RepID=UPI0034533D76